MRFAVDADVFAALPGLRIGVVVAAGVDNRSASPGVAAAWREAWAGAAAAAEYGNAQSHPRVAPWRQAWRANGISAKRFPGSIEALLRRAMKGGEPFTVNPLVDFYNAVSLRHVVPAGGFDLEALDGDLELRTSAAGDTFQPLDEADAAPVPAGELAYATGSTVLTRHLVWRQSRQALIAPETRELVLVSEVLAGLPAELPETVAADLAEGLERLFGATTRRFVVDAASPVAAW